MSRRVAAFVALLLAASLPARAEFSELTRAMESRLGSRTWIPMLGLARTVVRIVHPRGVRDVQLAVFEDSRRVDGAELERIFRQYVGRGFSPLVTVRSKGETTLVYARPAGGDDIEMTLFVQDGAETVLVRVAVAADVVARQLRDARQITVFARR